MKVVLIAAVSLDGFITRHDKPGSGFTSEADKRYLRDILNRFDACIVGAESFRVSRNWMLSRLMPDKLRVAVTRTPEAFADVADPDSFEFTSQSPRAIVEDLRTRGHHLCALLGGGRIYSLFLQARCVDELWVTLEARLFGSGTPFCPGQFDFPLELLSHDSLDRNTLLLKYRPRQGSG